MGTAIRGSPRRTPVLVNGKSAQVVGRVSMDLMTIDLRGQPDARGRRSRRAMGRGLAGENRAAEAGTISYELTCSITRRVRFVED